MQRLKNQKVVFLFIPLIVLVFLTILALGVAKPPQSSPNIKAADGRTHFVSPTGSDTNPGTQASPYKTVAKALNVAVPGDKVQLLAGTYTEQIKVNKSGIASNPIIIEGISATQVILDGQKNKDKLIEVPKGVSYVTVRNMTIANSNGYGVSFSGANLVIEGLVIHDTQDHGLYIDGQHSVVRGNTVYLSNLSNKARTASSGWGSAIKCRVGGDDLLFEKNIVYHNYGEGIAITRCTNVTVRENRSYDNFAVNLYIDNSHDVLVERNFLSCSANSGFEYLSGKRGSGIAIGEEMYDGWGAQLARVKIINNISAFCNKGISVFAPDVSNGGMKNIQIVHNTIWGAVQTGISIEAGPATTGTIISNNIFHQPGGSVGYLDKKIGITWSNNFWVRSTAPESDRNITGVGDRFGDVKLATTPTDSAESFKLSAQSPAKDAGKQLNITADFAGSSRDASPDMGAWEFQGSVVLPTPSPSPSVRPTPSPSPSPTPSPTPSPSPSPTPSVSPSPSPTPRVSPTPTPTATPAVSPSPSPTPTATPEIGCSQADLNNDGIVDLRDYSLLAPHFLKSSFPASTDITKDGKVDLFDYSFMRRYFMKYC